MRVIIVCNTYFQFLTALQIKMKFLAQDYVAVLITDHVKNRSIIADKAKNKYFDEVATIDTKYISSISSPKIYFGSAIFKGIFGDTFGARLKESFFDVFFYYNDDIAAYALFAWLYSQNPKIKCCRYEEGILSYLVNYSVNKKLKAIHFIRSITKKAELKNSTKEFFCFNPDLYHGKLKAIGIPLFDKVSIEAFRYIFIEKEKDYNIIEKYIFMGSPYDNGTYEKIGERELVFSIAKIVGRDNLIVKLHPRDNGDDYIKNGIKVYDQSQVPWEVLQLTMNFSDKILLTTVSSSVLTLSLVSDCPIKTFLLHKLCNIPSTHPAKLMENLMNDLIDSSGFMPEKRNVIIVEDINSLKE